MANKGYKKMKIGIILTTFLRDDLMYKVVQSIFDNWNQEYELFIGNQSYDNNEDRINSTIKFMSSFGNHYHKLHYYTLPYDCGLSFARNYLVKEAHKQGCEYCFLTADSYMFEKYDFRIITQFLESDKDNAIVGFVERGKSDPYWKWDMKLVSKKHFLLTKPKRDIIEYKNYKFQPVDVCQNFFLAKTNVLIENQWDNELKLTEHEDFFYRLQQTNYKIFFNNSIKCQYIKNKPEAYSLKRKRIYNIYKKILQEKYNLSGWLKCDRS